MTAQIAEAAHPAGARDAAAEAAEAAGNAYSSAGRGLPRRRGGNSLLAVSYLILFSPPEFASCVQARRMQAL